MERDREERVSLDPLDGETALRALLSVKADDEDESTDDTEQARPDQPNRKSA